MRQKRHWYYPKGAEIQRPEGLPDSYEVHRYTRENGLPAAAVFGGRRSKPDWHYLFSSSEQCEQKISEWIEGQRRTIEYRANARKERNAPHDFKAGQIFSCSWGYDQTNVNFYQLVELKGKTMGYIVPIGAKTVSSNPPQEMVVANPDHIRDWDVLMRVKQSDDDKRKAKRLDKHGFSPSSGYTASPWSGQPKYETSPGWGH